MRPAWDRREHHGFGEDVLVPAELFALIAGRMLSGAVEPVPLERRAVQKSPGGMYAGPLTDPLHQVLLDAVRQDVLQALDLGGFFAGDDDHPVTVPEHRSFPAGQPVDLT